MSLINGLSAMGEGLAKSFGVMSLEAHRSELEEKRLALAEEMVARRDERRADLQDRSILRAGATLGAAYGLGPKATDAPPVSDGAPSQGAPGSNANRIAAIESGGKYDAIGPAANDKGQRAYGKYQVMDFNIGPWTKEVLGKELTPKEFLANPNAQNAVFEKKFGEYVTQYGSPEAASRAWFAGPGGMNNPAARDVNGMTVANYERKFSGAAPATSAAPSGKITPAADGFSDPPPVLSGDDKKSVGSAPSVPDIARPKVTPDIVQKHMSIMMAGGYGKEAGEALKGARAAIEHDVDQAWLREREVANKRYEQKYEEFKHERKRGEDETKRGDDERKEKFTNASKLRDDFNGLQPVKDYRKAATVFRSAVDAAATDSAAADLNMVYAFATLMDPGSVVRDSETGMVIATQSASDQIKALVARVSGGSRLSPESKSALIKQMGSRHDSYKAAHDHMADTYTGMAKRNGLNPEDVITSFPEVDASARRSGGDYAENAPSQKELEDFARGDREAPQGALPKIRGNADFERLKPGTLFIDPEGKTRRKP